MKKKKKIIYIIISFITFILAVIGVKYSPDWLIVASLTVIIGLLATIIINLLWTPKPFRALKKKINTANELSVLHPILKQFYSNAIGRIDLDLDQVIKGKFRFQITEVPDISITAMELVNKKCALMFPIDRSEKLLTPEHGAAYDYYLQMKEASRKMKEDGLTGVVRVFVINQLNDISSNLLRFIQRNIHDEIDVKLIFESELPPLLPDIEGLDFGYYETKDGHKWIMLLRSLGSGSNNSLTDYIVETDAQIVEHYDAYSEAVINKAHTYEEFMKILMNPIHGDLWPTYFAERGFEMNPPHGLSDEDADYIVDSVFKSMESDYKPAVLVLGFTPKILRRLVEAETSKVVSIDQFTSKPTAFKGEVEFKTANWLNMSFDEKFDAIVFDESINNLTKIQLNLFFQNFRNILNPGGHFIGRVMGRFDEDITRKYANITSWEAVEMLRQIEGGSHDDFSPLIICLLHSKSIAFSGDSSLVDCDSWNNVLTDLHVKGKITKTEYEQWKLQFSFKLLSPDLDLLLKESKEIGLNPFEIKQIEGSYAVRYKDVRNFYRIINFEFVGVKNNIL